MKFFLHPVRLGALLAVLSLSSCVYPYAGPGQTNGAVVGALAGGAAGAVIGNQSDRPLEGAAIGGVLGALAGAAIGQSQDYNYSRPYYGSYAPRTTYVYRESYYPRPVYRSYGYGYGSYGRSYGSYCAPRYYSHHHHCR